MKYVIMAWSNGNCLGYVTNIQPSKKLVNVNGNLNKARKFTTVEKVVEAIDTCQKICADKPVAFSYKNI